VLEERLVAKARTWKIIFVAPGSKNQDVSSKLLSWKKGGRCDEYEL